MGDPKDIVRRGYDQVAEAYLARFGSSAAKLRWADELARRTAPGGRILDLGCGAGVPVARRLAEQAFAVVGVDISPRQVELARRNVPQAEFILSDFASLALPDDAFDAVAAFFSFNHLPRDQHAAVLRSIGRWLRPGGVFVGNFGVGGEAEWVGEWLGADTFFSSFDAATGAELVAASGLAVEVASVQPSDDEDAAFLWVVATRPH